MRGAAGVRRVHDHPGRRLRDAHKDGLRVPSRRLRWVLLVIEHFCVRSFSHRVEGFENKVWIHWHRSGTVGQEFGYTASASASCVEPGSGATQGRVLLSAGGGAMDEGGHRSFQRAGPEADVDALPACMPLGAGCAEV